MNQPQTYPLNKAESFLAISKDIFTSVAKMILRPKTRNRKEVNKDYGGGRWLQVLNEKEWEKYQDLHEMLINISSARPEMISLIDNKIVRIKATDYYDFKINVLQEIISKWAGDADELYELGSGYGYNLFCLALDKKKNWKKLTGFELSTTGVEVGTKIAAHFKLSQMSFEQLDLLDSTSPGFAKLKDKVAYSHYCFEQLRHHTETAILNLIKARPKRIIHLETSYELLEPGLNRDLATLLYVKRMDYQDNLLNTLKKLEKENKLRIVNVERLKHSPTLKNEPTLICWEPV